MSAWPSRMSAAVVLLALACAAEPSEPPQGFAFAAGTPECGPADGPAVAILLSGTPVASVDPTTPYVRLYVWRGVTELGGQSWSLAGAGAEGSATYVSAPGTFQAASSGTLTVTAVRPDTTIEGEVDVTFPTVGRVRGGFRATWLPRTLMCG